MISGINTKWLVVFAVMLLGFAAYIGQVSGGSVTPFPVDFSVNGTPVAQRAAVNVIGGANTSITANDSGSIIGVEYTVNASVSGDTGVNRDRYKAFSANDNVYFAGGDTIDFSGSDPVAVDTLYAIPIYLGGAFNTDALTLNVGVAGGVGSLGRACLYADNGSVYPGALIQDAGTFATDTTGYKKITFTRITLSAGLHWISVFVNDGTTEILHSSDEDVTGVHLGYPSNQTNRKNWGYSDPQTFGVCPANYDAAATLLNTVGDNTWLLGIRLVP